jgi:hypothetical protein
VAQVSCLSKHDRKSGTSLLVAGIIVCIAAVVIFWSDCFFDVRNPTDSAWTASEELYLTKSKSLSSTVPSSSLAELSAATGRSSFQSFPFFQNPKGEMR